jgi:SAM-dependent methyltransferase
VELDEPLEEPVDEQQVLAAVRERVGREATMTAPSMSASARMWGSLWGDRPRAWALSEEQQTPMYEEALRCVEVGPGERVLDVGCGTGVFLRMCADRGAIVSGLDAAEGLLSIARARVPEADLRLEDLQVLPYPDDTFDVVTGFTSLFFADDMVGALRETARVARPGAPVVIQVFGRPEHCDLEAVKLAIAAYRPGGTEEQYWRPGMVDELAVEAGLVVERSFDSTWAYSYADDEALGDAMLAAGGAAAVAGAREPELRADILRALAGCRQPDCSYRVSNEWHVVIARA